MPKGSIENPLEEFPDVETKLKQERGEEERQGEEKSRRASRQGGKSRRKLEYSEETEAHSPITTEAKKNKPINDQIINQLEKMMKESEVRGN